MKVRFRVGKVYRNCYVNVRFDEEQVIHKKRLYAEMEELTLKKEQLAEFSQLKKITISMEEA